MRGIIAMAKVKKDPKREHRIEMEIIVDAYDEAEKALGWYYYLKDNINFPFSARCVLKRATSPLQMGDEVEVLKMAPEDECEHEMFVVIRWAKGFNCESGTANPSFAADSETKQAVEDWHYWIKQGYQF